MITQETAVAIWTAYREIEAGKKLLADLAEERKKDVFGENKFAPTIKDAFGRKRHLQLGIPCGDNGHRLLDVNPALAESVIRAHIAEKEAELVRVNEQARIELDTKAGEQF